jgi:Protein of unknown function (DUF2971)
MSHNVPNRLYHYCSLQGLRGIIEQKHLRMTSVFWMDDTTEMFWFHDVAMRVMDRKPADRRNDLHKQFEQLMEDRALSYVFCACFSEEPDARSQWLEYADNGHGFAIGFDPNALDLTRASPARDIDLQPVIYDEQEQERMGEEIVRFLQKHGDTIGNKLRLAFAGHNAWWHGVRCKNPTFKNEREWRLIYRDNPGDDLDFRERAGRQLVPFVKFEFDPAKNPIREIWLGPRNHSQRNVDAIADLLRICGYDVAQIKFPASRIPLHPEY